MTEQGHNIPSWYIPNEEKVLANEHEREQIEEKGELAEPLCPYCGEPYKSESNGVYTHAFVRKDVGGRFETNMVWRPAIMCVAEDDKRYENGVLDAETTDIR